MARIDCRGGHTQIGKVLSHALKENEQQKVQALAFVGDAMEESVDVVCSGRQLGLRGLPTFMFQEGGDAVTEAAYREIARLSRGAYAGSTPAPRNSSANCCAPRRPMRPAE